MGDLDALLSEDLKGRMGVARTRTTVVLGSAKETSALPYSTSTLALMWHAIAASGHSRNFSSGASVPYARVAAVNEVAMGRWVALVIVALGAVAGAGAQQAASGIFGFTTASEPGQRELERRFLALPSADRARDYHRYLTDEPHVAGSDRNKHLAEWMRGLWKEYRARHRPRSSSTRCCCPSPPR